MESFEYRQYQDRSMRDAAFTMCRHDGDPCERQVVKFSEAEPVMVSESEFQLDARGRVVYRSLYFLAWPREINGHRARRRADQESERGL